MGVLDVPKALYKAKQAQNKISKIRAVGGDGFLGILLNGLSDIEEAEIDRAKVYEFLGDSVTDKNKLDQLLTQLEENIKNANKKAKKQLEEALKNSTDLDELRSLFGG